MQHMGLSVIGMAKCAVGKVRLQLALIRSEVGKRLLQTLQRLGLCGWRIQRGRAGNGLIQRMAHRTARGKHAKRQRADAAAEPTRLEFGITADGILDALRAVVEHFGRAPALEAAQWLIDQTGQKLLGRIQADCGWRLAAGQCPEPGPQSRYTTEGGTFQNSTSLHYVASIPSRNCR